MQQFFPERLIRLLALLLFGASLASSVLAQSVTRWVPGTTTSAPAPAPAAAINFCMAEPVARAVGTAPGRAADCPAGYTNQAGSCKREGETRPAPSVAPDCPAGYKADGNSCERPAQSKPNPGVRAADCPDGYSNSGTACFRLSAPDPLPANRMTCRAGETKLDGRCYKACEAGTTSAGANCVRPASTLGADKMSCRAGYQKDDARNRCLAQCAPGFTNTGEACVRAADTLAADALSCKAGETRQGARCMPTVASCAKGEVLQAGTCYAACAPGQDGVGAACWPQPPKSWIACGAGAAKDAQSCAAAKLDQITLLRHLAVGLGRDGNVAAAPGQQVTRLVALHGKFRELAAAYNSVKDTAQFKRDLAAWQAATQGKETFTPFDESGAPVTEPAMMRHAVQLAAIAGFSGTATPGAYPKCSDVK